MTESICEHSLALTVFLLRINAIQVRPSLIVFIYCGSLGWAEAHPPHFFPTIFSILILYYFKIVNIGPIKLGTLARILPEPDHRLLLRLSLNHL